MSDLSVYIQIAHQNGQIELKHIEEGQYVRLTMPEQGQKFQCVQIIDGKM